MSYLCLNINVVFFIKYVNCVSFFFIILFRVLIILFYFYWCFYFVFVIVLLDPRPMSFRPEGGPNFSFRCRPFHGPIKVQAGHKARPTMSGFFLSPMWSYFSRRKALPAEAICLSYVHGTFPCTFFWFLRIKAQRPSHCPSKDPSPRAISVDCFRRHDVLQLMPILPSFRLTIPPTCLPQSTPGSHVRTCPNRSLPSWHASRLLSPITRAAKSPLQSPLQLSSKPVDAPIASYSTAPT